MLTNRRWVLASRPKGAVTPDNFRLEETEVATPSADGEVLVRNHYMSLDPYMRGRMDDARSYTAAQKLDEVMGGGTAGEVLASRHPDFAVGDRVVGMLGWQLYGKVDGKALKKVDIRRVPLSAHLGVLGMPGVTAWVGLNTIIEPKAGQTVVVSAASGAVGATVGQLARLAQCRVVGVAGGPDKCRAVVEEFGFDACVDYKAGRLHDDLKAAVGLFIEHLAIAAEEVAEPKGNYAFDQSIKGLDKYSVSSVTLRGGDSDPDGLEEPKPVQVFIFGNKRLKPGYKKNFGTYGIKLASPQEPYKFAVALEQHVAALESEAWDYLDGKHAPPAQTALNLDAHDDSDGEDVKLLEEGE